MQHILTMRNITKKFPGVLALNDVSFSVDAGEVFSIIGSNGAGKSTLMKVLSGAYPSTTYTGKIAVDGRDVSFLTPADAENAGIAMIYQEISLMLDLSIAENIFMGNIPQFGGSSGIVDSKRMLQMASELLDQVGLSLNPKTMVRTLSTSQQQMLSIAKAMAKKPRILVLDEPTSTLTETEVKYLFTIIEKLKSTGVSCLYISHKLDEVFALSDHIMVMRDGSVQGVIEKKDVEPNKVISMMIGQQYTAFKRSKSKIDTEGEEVFAINNYSVKHPYSPGANILNNISFGVKKGEILGLVGLVGSGRSELVTSIFGYKNKAEGDVMIEGRKVSITSPLDAKQYGLALLTEDRKVNGFVALMDIKENITLPNLKQVSTAGIISNASERENALRYKESLAIKANSIFTNLSTLSGGNQQKVVLGKWLMSMPKVLFLDEPTRGIDVGAKYEIYRLIEDLAYDGMSVVLISSEWDELMNLCDRFVVLAKGKIADILNKGEIDEIKVNQMIAGL